MASKATIVAARLAHQSLATPLFPGIVDLVSWLCATQAQDYSASKWALGLRAPSTVTEYDIQMAVDRGEILRTHVLRPTWHLVAKEDVDWMIQVTAPRVHQRMAPTLRSFGLEPAIRVKAARVIERALRDGDHLTRSEIGTHLARARLPSSGAALGLLAMFAELERVMCSGVFRGKQLTYAGYSSRVPVGRSRHRDEAIAELARRYFQSHGPATLRDFVWWSSLATVDAKRGLEANRARPCSVDGVTYWTIGQTPAPPRRASSVRLLPIYDEFCVAYRDRVAVPLWHAHDRPPRFEPAIVIDGQVAGAWRTTTRSGVVDVRITPVRRLTQRENAGIRTAADRYGRFLGRATSATVTPHF